MTKKMIKREIDIIRNECYVFMPDNFDRMKMINTALDDILDFVERRINAMKCDSCGNEFSVGSSNGMPNGISFELHDGRLVTLCQKCIMKLGSLKDEEKEDFFNSLGEKER